MRSLSFWNNPAASTFQLSRYLAQVRAKPAVNYCAWNEPSIQGWDEATADRVRQSQEEWPLIGARQAAYSFVAFLWRRRRKPTGRTGLGRLWEG